MPGHRRRVDDDERERAAPTSRSTPPPRPAGWQDEVLRLQRDAGNSAVASLLEREDKPATGGPSPALSYLDLLARGSEPVPVAVPAGLAGNRAWAVRATVDDAAQLARLAGRPLSPGTLSGGPPLESVTLIYTNDGKGPFPNIGGGADHELTAGAQVRFNFANEGTGWTSGGYNLEIWTPQKGGPPTPLLGYEPGLYPGQPGPAAGGYKGLVYADFAYRLSGNGKEELTLLTRMGANSTWLGEEIQSNWVHRPLDIALFDWKHEPTEAYGALGLRAQTVLDLIGDEALSEADFQLRLTLSAQGTAGTHDAAAGGAATLSLRSGFIRLAGPTRAALELRFGADGKGQARYNDQGGERVGLEAGVSNEVRLQLRDVDLPWLPAFDVTLFAGGRSQQSTLPEGRAAPGEDRPGATGAWLGPGSKTQGWIGVEIPLR